MNDEERKQEFSFGFDVEEANKSKKKKKKKRGKKGNKSSLQNNVESGSESDGEMDELIKIVSDTVTLADRDAKLSTGIVSAPPPGLSTESNIKIVDKTTQSKIDGNSDDEDDGDNNQSNSDGKKKKKKKNNKKKKSGTAGGGDAKSDKSKKIDDDDDFLNAAIAKADADRVVLEKAKKAADKEKEKARKAVGGKPKGPVFVTADDPGLDSSAKAKAKFGQGKNLVAVGPAKVRDSNWLQASNNDSSIPSRAAPIENAKSKDQGTKTSKAAAVAAATSDTVENSALPADTKYHNSPFTFGFGFDF